MNVPGPKTSPTAAPPPVNAPTPQPRRRHWLLWTLGGLLALFIVLIGVAAFTLWWIQRPIRPVVLTVAEKQVVDAKLRILGATPVPVIEKRSSSPSHPSDRRETTRAAESAQSRTEDPNFAPATPAGADPVYVPGSKVLTLTERELNGLLNANTDLGETVRLQLGQDAINAYLAIPIPEDFPIGGGKTLRMRGRFKVSIGENSAPFAILEDVTVFGLSLPKDWLGGIKGENLISEAVGNHDGKPLIKGIKSLQIKPGALVLEVTD